MKLTKEQAKKVDYVSDERANGDGFWIYLKRGWWYPEMETHCIHEETMKYAKSLLKYVEPCKCEWCNE